MSVPEHALSQLTHHNVELILASSVPRLQFPCRILLGNPFLLPYEVPAREILDPLLSKSEIAAIDFRLEHANRLMVRKPASHADEQGAPKSSLES